MISRSNFKLFMISRIIEVSVLKSCQPWPLNQLISLTTNLIIPNITKTSSSKFCLKLYYQRPSWGLTPGNPRYFHNGTHNKINAPPLTQEQYFSTKKLPFPLPPRAELVQMRAQVTKCSISRHSQIAIKFSSCFIK